MRYTVILEKEADGGLCGHGTCSSWLCVSS